MKAVAVASLLAVAGCVIQQPAPKAAEPAACPASRPAPPATKPVWPDTCVADWYARAELPPCVEDYLQSVKNQQRAIAKKHKRAGK